MNERRTETINLGKGVQYAKVASRSAEFHRDNEQCHIETTCEFREGWVIFAAKVTTKKGTFTGHSMEKITGQSKKQFEKQETIAVGRALAFAGYLASGDIACAEEMADVVTTTQLNSLKLKFSKVNEDELSGLDRPEKQERFRVWCREIIGEEVNYADAANWNREWFDTCWKHLLGTSSDVPFEV